MKLNHFCLLALPAILFTSLTFTASADDSLGSTELIRKSKSGICHEPSSPYYRRLKGYMTYKSMQDCLVSGGRALKEKEKEDPGAATPLPPCDPRQLEEKTE